MSEVTLYRGAVPAGAGRVSGFGFRVLGSRFRVSGFGHRGDLFLLAQVVLGQDRFELFHLPLLPASWQ